MTPAPGPSGPPPASNQDTFTLKQDDLPTTPATATAMDSLRASTTAAGDTDTLADASSDETARGLPAPDSPSTPAHAYVPSPLSYARPAFAPRPSSPQPFSPPAPFTPSTAPSSYEGTASVGAPPDKAPDLDTREYLHPGDHLPEPELNEHDWQRVDRAPHVPVTDYSVFRYVRPAPVPASPQTPEAEAAPETSDTPALGAGLPDVAVGAHDMRPDSSMLPGPGTHPDPSPAAFSPLTPLSPADDADESPALTDLPVVPAPMRILEDQASPDVSAVLEAAPAASEASTASPAPDFLALAGMLGMGLARVESNGTVWPLNQAGAALLEALGSPYGGHAPNAIIEALGFARAGNKPFLRDTPAPSPEARHISVAAFAGPNGGGLVAMRDHTEETLLQERLLQSEKMASVGQLVSGVAHELNNPLTGVMGFAQLLLARELDLTVRGQIQTIYGEAERAAKIVQNLLSFARRRKPTKEMCDINALLQRVLELRSYDFNIRNISLDMTMDSRMESVWADPDQIQQVFFNVIKNAEQAMIDAHRGGKLSVTTIGIADGVRISIADSGPGIPADVQRRIFDPFFTTKEAGEGTGLGLTICYGIMEEHSGRIWTENLPAGGASFNIELPVGKPDEPDLYDRGVDDNSLLPAPSVSSRKVLVVDDEESIRLLLHDILRLDDHAVRVARSGLEAFELVRSEHFDVIITDMKMPGMDGASFYREVRLRDPALARRIVFITGDTVSPDTRAFLQRVSNPVLSKPFKIGPLRDAIETVLHQQ